MNFQRKKVFMLAFHVSASQRFAGLMAILVLCSAAAVAKVKTPFPQTSSLETWVVRQTEISETRMRKNISPEGTAKGIILASPQRQDPDYYFHWVRDSALVIDALITHETSTSEQNQWRGDFVDFLNLSLKLQEAPALTGLGEPRFNIDGTPYMGDWARPQDDGPALRILTMLSAFDLEADPVVRGQILKSVETDVGYLLLRWREPSFDLWEEVRGLHFYTGRVHLAALEQVLLHFDPSWSFHRDAVAEAIHGLRASLATHWRAEKGYYSVTVDRREGAEKYKFTELDTAVILAVLHAKAGAGEFGLDDNRILATASALEAKFIEIYTVNQPGPGREGIAPAIGRYSDDVYFGGNPWYITTAAFAEFHYKLGTLLQQKNSLVVTAENLVFFQNVFANWDGRKPSLRIGAELLGSKTKRRTLLRALKLRGDQFLARIQLHTPADGGMAEQFDRNTAAPVSARDLTWSYASFLTAVQARGK